MVVFGVVHSFDHFHKLTKHTMVTNLCMLSKNITNDNFLANHCNFPYISKYSYESRWKGSKERVYSVCWWECWKEWMTPYLFQKKWFVKLNLLNTKTTMSLCPQNVGRCLHSFYLRLSGISYNKMPSWVWLWKKLGQQSEDTPSCTSLDWEETSYISLSMTNRTETLYLKHHDLKKCCKSLRDTEFSRYNAWLDDQ